MIQCFQKSKIIGGVMQNESTNNQKSGMPIVAKVILILGILIAGLGFVFLLSDHFF